MTTVAVYGVMFTPSRLCSAGLLMCLKTMWETIVIRAHSCNARLSMFHRRCSLIWNCLTYSANILGIQLSLHRPSKLNILSYYDNNIMMSLNTCGFIDKKNPFRVVVVKMMIMMVMILKQYCYDPFFSFQVCILTKWIIKEFVASWL